MMSKTLPRLRSPTLDDIKRTATAATPPEHDATPPPTPDSAPEAEAPATGRALALVESPTSADEQRLGAALDIVARYRKWTIAAAAAPIPLADAALVSGVQLRMVSRLARLYGVPFERVRVVSLLSALFGGWTPYTIATGIAGAAARMAPGVGTVIGVATSIGTSTLATETIGKIFIQHFEKGGTFLDFEPRKYRNAANTSKAAGRRR
ncbi:MAG TPA: DUF697 domain-containing protein [Stellaceae bacterium]|jgi:uncharacterized protein (DUF697 family)|nr:DUF697 domain-containing protein [Stellaceae bacterium]